MFARLSGGGRAATVTVHSPLRSHRLGMALILVVSFFSVFLRCQVMVLFLVCPRLDHDTPAPDMFYQDLFEEICDPAHDEFEITFVPLFDRFQDEINDGASVLVE